MFLILSTPTGRRGSTKQSEVDACLQALGCDFQQLLLLKYKNCIYVNVQGLSEYSSSAVSAQ
jgi:hypothetical protein